MAAAPPPEARPGDWTPIDERMPPEGLVVDVVTPHGQRLRLKWQGRLWRFPDQSHYLFYTPLYWRPLAAADPPESEGCHRGPGA